MREDLVSQAVSFLADDKIKSSPLAKKISFLEGKGLSGEEIGEAVSRCGKQAEDKSDTRAALPPVPAPRSPQKQLRNETRKRPWIDLVFFSALVGGVSFLFFNYAKRFLSYLFADWPFFPGESRQIRDELAKIEESLGALKGEHLHFQKKVADQSESLSDLIAKGKKEIEQWSADENKCREDLLSLNGLLQKLNDSLPQVQSQARETLSACIGEWNSELSSLKTIILSRNSRDEIVSSALSQGGPAAEPREAYSQENAQKPGYKLPSWQMEPIETKKVSTQPGDVPA